MSNYYLNIAIAPLKQELTYLGPEDLQVGDAVEVKLNRKTKTGFIISKHAENPLENCKFNINPVETSLGPVFSIEQLEFFKWIADYYQEPLSKVIDTGVPQLPPPKREAFIALKQTDPSCRLGPLQQSIVETLSQQGGSGRLADLAILGASYRSSVRSLEKLNIVEISQRTTEEIPVHMGTPQPAKLNDQQCIAADTIIQQLNTNKSQSFLLKGITGSGKTEVYINCIIRARQLGLGCLVLVPEISLTPQLIGRLEEKIGESIGVLHSGLPPRQRASYWRLALSGRLGVVLGARSALFAPVSNLGLIIVDEEHDQSFKQSDSLRYHARDLALVRAQLAKCPIVLGSATPSLESYLNTYRKKHQLLTLSKRFGSAQLPRFECVDLSQLKRKHMASRNISLRLYEAISETLAAGKQAFILYNRRGYASFLLCTACNESVFCPHCDVTLTFHESIGRLVCHYCYFSIDLPARCPQCSAPSLQKIGAGTQKIDEEIKNLFPNATTERLDRDNAPQLRDCVDVLDKVKSGETQILIGTQMIAKGHDLPKVTLVGVVDCDISLHMPDFRAAEKNYQLLTQVGGRAGRGQDKGLVLLQTRNPEHIALVTAIRNDYENFAAHELKERKILNYPPFWKLLRIVASSTIEKHPQNTLEILAAEALKISKQLAGKVVVLGPSPAPIVKVKDRWRWHLIIKAENTRTIHNLLSYLKSGWKEHPSTRVTFDLDAYDML